MEPTSAVLQLNSQAFTNDLLNSVSCNCADAFDQLDEDVLRQLHPRLTPEQQAAVLQGTAVLYEALDAELREQLAKFERHVLDGCLHVPAGLLAPPPLPADGGDGAAAFEAVSEVEEAAAQAEYARLRGELRAAQDAARGRQREIRQLEAAVQWSREDAERLAAVVAQVAGKENGLADDAQAVAKVAMGAEAAVAEAGVLQARLQHLQAGRPGSAGGQQDGAAAERDILRRQAEMASKPPDALARIQERLAS
eukprot:scaffold2.g7115.t1